MSRDMKAKRLPTWLVLEAERAEDVDILAVEGSCCSICIWKVTAVGFWSTVCVWLCIWVCVFVPQRLPNVFNVCVFLINSVWKEQRKAINKDAGSVGHSTNRIVGIHPPPLPLSHIHSYTHTHTLALKMFIGTVSKHTTSKHGKFCFKKFI